ncbi:pilus assembly protein N-terminal domain-containing protein [Polycladidibacter stylochi]|uniref:pilus assembly protein N-terminal domain-containing protein n=1 Tax=Polycladidibacter stylochi TaxID=1807766 RepID=UPI00082AB88D|nr:pilus assembly protein N-terminal domain-containing protein [Pseudovibrio stylochi]
MAAQVKYYHFLALVAGLCLPTSSSVLANDVQVITDQAKVFRIEEPASTVVIGNPAIADVVIHEGTTVIVTGKSYGSTNLIILNQDAEPIVDEMITVSSAEDKFVVVQRNSARSSYTCNPECEPALRVGDVGHHFSSMQSQSQQRNDMAKSK